MNVRISLNRKWIILQFGYWRMGVIHLSCQYILDNVSWYCRANMKSVWKIINTNVTNTHPYRNKLHYTTWNIFKWHDYNQMRLLAKWLNSDAAFDIFRMICQNLIDLMPQRTVFIMYSKSQMFCSNYSPIDFYFIITP